ncbi:MAG TPA: T9SS type A sorting domain-containing protein [Ginsengibacter sp.]
MKCLSFLIPVSLLFSCMNSSAEIHLIALTNFGSPAVKLQWNMVNYPGNTAYTLFKSTDGVIWMPAAANPVFRNYTAATVLAYRDNFSDEQQLYYRVKVYDTNENIVEISNTAMVNNPITSRTNGRPLAKRNTTVEKPVTGTSSNAWQIVPNPVQDILNLVYRRSDVIKGVINIVIQDATGKVVTRFRAASNNRQLHIPVSNLHAGIYFIKINVASEVQLNDKFVKQ